MESGTYGGEDRILVEKRRGKGPHGIPGLDEKILK